MSPNMMWTIAGLVLAVLTLGGVTLSSYQSVDAAGAKMLAIEAGNIAVATKMWVANDASDGTFSSINAASMAKYIPDFTVGGSGATSYFQSKASSGVQIAVITAGSPHSQVKLTISAIPFDQFSSLNTALTGKACTVATTTAATSGNKDGVVTYTCNG